MRHWKVRFAIPENYHGNSQETLGMLHMFQYGIFRNGNNTWALDEAYRWMELRNICYKKDQEITFEQVKVLFTGYL